MSQSEHIDEKRYKKNNKKLRVSDTAADRSYTGSKIKIVFRQKTAASPTDNFRSKQMRSRKDPQKL